MTARTTAAGAGTQVRAAHPADLRALALAGVRRDKGATEELNRVPEISRFFGIVIRMFFNDHQPPHFHALYGEHEALIEIETLDVYRGEIPRRALALVLEWAMLHRQELRHDWQLAASGRAVEPIQPLD